MPCQSPRKDSHVCIVGNLDTSERLVDISRKTKEPKKISKEKSTSAITTSQEEVLFICKQVSINFANEEFAGVIYSGNSHKRMFFILHRQ